jgi:hypothetical protein
MAAQGPVKAMVRDIPGSCDFHGYECPYLQSLKDLCPGIVSRAQGSFGCLLEECLHD